MRVGIFGCAGDGLRGVGFGPGQIAAFETIRGLSDTAGDFRYADGKWTVKEVLGHMADAERVFAYRLLRIARFDQTPLAGFDENAWAAVAPHARRPLAAVVDELAGSLAAKSGSANRTVKTLVNRAGDDDLATGLAAEIELVARHMRSPDAVEGLRAFVEKRAPKF